ncbi:MAG TPA: response regulator [Pyrinomonadaceae bacterium]|nr:response regulator [Pyrinomonadaceae bacterium]
MTETPTDANTGRDAAPAKPGSVLLVADEAADTDEAADGTDNAALDDRLANAGFEVVRATPDEAARRVKESAPAVVVLAFGSREGEGRLSSLARRLRSEPTSFALPVVFLFRTDNRSLRSAAQHLGADDYFSRDATAEELRARLDALLWRAEAGRRSAPSVAEQRSEIDNFLFLLDAVGSDLRDGANGSLALVEAGGRGDDVDRPASDNGLARRAPTLTRAHGFLKLNLRRVDAVAFYGPATLLVYLARADASAARATLSRLRAEFAEANAGSDLFAGISSFPADGAEVERLVEQAEAALAEARGENSAARVVVYGMREARPAAADAERRAGVSRSKDFLKEIEPAAADGSAVDSLTGAAGRAASTLQPADRRAGARARRVMLVVSDASRMAQINLLLRSAAYEVRAAFDGSHALNLLRIDSPDALVVDYALNEMDGVEMLRRLTKQSRAGSAPPALLLLPAGREELRGEALAAGARRVVNTPYDAVELLDALSELSEPV